MKFLSFKPTPNRILAKLIKFSNNTYGVIEDYNVVCNYFKNIPKEELYKICIFLSRNLYIDYDYNDDADYSFNKLYILPQAYVSNKTAINNKINLIVSTLALIAASISAVISLLTIL